MNDVHENPELQFNWGLNDVDSQSKAEVEMTNRVRLRNRSYSC